MSSADGILLAGLDGSNPLAFLAALGTLRTLALALPDETVRMSWEEHEGAWRPRAWCSLAADDKRLIEAICVVLASATDRESFQIGDNLNLPATGYRECLKKAVERAEILSNPTARIDVDFFAAFGSEVVTNDDGTMQDTALRTMSGAGHQHFLQFFRELVGKTDSSHLHRSLLLEWDYADEGRGMNLRWDPLDDRRYALRWENPSGDPVKAMRGANRLAIEALPLLPTMGVGGRLATTAFKGVGARGTYFTWPIWQAPLNTLVVGSLLACGSEMLGDRDWARRIGVSAYRTSARITIGKFGKFRNFAPSISDGIADSA